MLRRLDCAPLCDGNLAGTTVPSDVTGGPDQEPQKPELDPHVFLRPPQLHHLSNPVQENTKHPAAWHHDRPTI